jgi:hypothetical protein
MAQNRELSQFASYVNYDSNGINIAITTTSGSPFVGIGSIYPEQKFTVNGNAYINGNLGIGVVNPQYGLTVYQSNLPFLNLTGAIGDFTNNTNSFSQINNRNTNNGANASSDYIITADTGTDSTNYLDLGLNNSGFTTSSSWSINGALDGYLYTSDGNLSIGAASAKYVSFFTNGLDIKNERLRITSTGNVGIGTINPTSKLTVQGDLNVSGTIINSSITAFSIAMGL